MSLNCNEINVILSELDLPGSFIQHIVQPGFDSIALYLYKNGQAKTVLVCLAPGACRIHETRKKIPRSSKPLRFMEFLRSRIKGAKIVSCAQIGLERIIQLELIHGGEQFCMFIRLWSGAANIIVTDANLTVLDVFYRRPKRNEITGAQFPLAEYKNTAAQKQTVQADSTAQPAAAQFPVRTFSELPQTGTDGSTPLSFNQKTDIWYSEHAETLSKNALLEQAQKLYVSHRSRMESALRRLESKREQFLSAGQWKHQGDLILTYGHMLTGESDFLECTDYDTGATVCIPVNPAKSVQENAGLYYEKYKKAVSGLENLEYDIKKAKSDIAKLDADHELLLKEQNPIRLQQIMRQQNKPLQQIEKKVPGIAYELNGWRILVGRTATENDELLRHHVRGQDMWMHTRDWPGGYVFVKYRAGKTIPLDILLAAGNLAVYHSKARKARTADLYYTPVKYLRRAKNAPKGTVLPTQEKNLPVTLDEHLLRNLEKYQLQPS